MSLTYGSEKPLFVIALIISIIVWIALVVGTIGVALLWMLLFFIMYLFTHSGFISYLKGSGVRLSEQQYPEIHQMYQQCCQKLGFQKYPEVYLLSGHGVVNALATRFLGSQYVVLYSDVVDALLRKPAAMKFYLGHELGHIKQSHLTWAPIIFPALLLPLLGAAYSRAREYTCDLHGLACCDDPKDALMGVAVLAAGHKVWPQLNVAHYVDQSRQSGKFWMAFHELINDYPWLAKRMARILASLKGEKVDFPTRNPFAYLFALFVPRTGVGGGASGAVSLVVVVAIIGILAAIAIPAYEGYLAKSQVNAGLEYSQIAMHKVEDFILSNHKLPDSLEASGFHFTPNPSISKMELDSAGSIVVHFAKQPIQDQTLEFKPYLDKDKHIQWDCHGGSLKLQFRPQQCR